MADTCNPNIIVQGPFYRVVSDLRRAPTEDYLMHGYETEHDFYSALRRLRDLWHEREGECIDERNGFLRLRFHDTPGGHPDEAWLPLYLLDPIPVPEYAAIRDPTPDELLERELDEAFGFD